MLLLGNVGEFFTLGQLVLDPGGSAVLLRLPPLLLFFLLLLLILVVVVVGGAAAVADDLAVDDAQRGRAPGIGFPTIL